MYVKRASYERFSHFRMQEKDTPTDATPMVEDLGTTFTAALCMIIIIGMTISCMCFWFCPIVPTFQKIECCGGRLDEFHSDDDSNEIFVSSEDRLKV